MSKAPSTSCNASDLEKLRGRCAAVTGFLLKDMLEMIYCTDCAQSSASNLGSWLHYVMMRSCSAVTSTVVAYLSFFMTKTLVFWMLCHSDANVSIGTTNCRTPSPPEADTSAISIRLLVRPLPAWERTAVGHRFVFPQLCFCGTAEVIPRGDRINKRFTDSVGQ